MTVLICGCRSKLSVAAASLRPMFLPASSEQLQLQGHHRLASSLRFFSASKFPPRKNLQGVKTTASNSRSTQNNSASSSPSPSHRTKRKPSAQRRAQTGAQQRSLHKQESQSKVKDERRINYTVTATTSNVLQPSGYVYDIRRKSDSMLDDVTSPAEVDIDDVDPPIPHFHLPALNAAALLDPHVYCKKSSKGSHTHGVSRSISGTDAARRLLRGKKEFLLQARELVQQKHTNKGTHKIIPVVLLEGHGVPSKLFQHCIDMADALLKVCSSEDSDVVECTFYNYNNQENREENMVNVLPEVLRLRSQDATNRCSPWPPENSKDIDWEYHLSLYLTVMERIASQLGMVLQPRRKSTAASTPSTESSSDTDDYEDVTASPLLFPNYKSPHWNVDILRGAYFDIQPEENGDEEGNKADPSSNTISPFPIVEFSQDSDTTGHVLIRMQGQSLPNSEFEIQGPEDPSPEPVTLVFDACFRSQ